MTLHPPAANLAIEDGTERLSKSLFDDIELDYAAEEQARVRRRDTSSGRYVGPNGTRTQGPTVRRLPLGVTRRLGEAFHSFAARLARELDISLRTLLTSTGLLDPRAPASNPGGLRRRPRAPTTRGLRSRNRALTRRCARACCWRTSTDSRSTSPPRSARPRVACPSRQTPMGALRRFEPLSRMSQIVLELASRGSFQWTSRAPSTASFFWPRVPHVWPAAGRRPPRRTGGAPIPRASPGHDGMRKSAGDPGPRRRRHSLRPSRSPALPTESLQRKSAIPSAQATLDAILAGFPTAALGTPVAPLEFFGDLRSVTALLLFCAGPNDFDYLTPATQAALDEHVARREAAERTRTSLPPRRGPRARYYMATPRSAALMAAIIPAALEIVTATSTREAGYSWRRSSKRRRLVAALAGS